MGKPTQGSDQRPLDRRGFIRGAAAGAAGGAAALVTRTGEAEPASRAPRSATAFPTEPELEAEETGVRIRQSNVTVESPASDFMVDVIRALDIEYVTTNPGSSFDGLHESIINYGNNTMPELLTCCHEESAVAMGHGYAKIEGKPLVALLHGTVGLQHASMAIYNAYADRVPVFIVVGLDYQGAVAAHNATDMAAMVRDFVKWDHQPASLTQFTQSAMRAYRLAMTAPRAPVLLVLDATIQKRELGANPPALGSLNLPVHPSADIGSIRETARLLVAAENPRITTGNMARTQGGIDLLVELAELVQAPVNGGTNRVNFPSRHPLAGNGAGGPYDFTLRLEGGGGFGGGGGAGVQAAGSIGSVSITSADFLATHNYNINGRGAPQGDMTIAADPESTLPGLIEEVRRLITPDRRRVFAERGPRHAEANREARRQAIENARYGWDASPISMPRLAAELWPLIRDDDWSLVCGQTFLGNWPGRLWNMDRIYRSTGSSGGAGIGYNAPAAVGAALANRKYGRLSINIQGDGDLNYAPGVLWTAAHHEIPLLTIMNNNRGYHAEVMIVQEIANERNRGADRAHIGTTLRNPDIDYAGMARAYGLYGEGPISDPDELGGALERGLERVRRGEPALLDVVTQPRS